VRFVFDTNVVVSPLMLSGSPPRRAFERARERSQLLVSEATLEELDDGLRRPKVARYGSEEQRLEFLAASIRDAEEVVVTTRLRECRDPNDDNMVELSPCEFLDRVADLVPPPRKHRHRCHGMFAPNHRLRKAVTSLAKKGTLASAARTRPAGMQSADASRTAAPRREKRHSGGERRCSENRFWAQETAARGSPAAHQLGNAGGSAIGRAILQSTMTIHTGGKHILLHGLALILAGLIFGFAPPLTPYPRLALGAHIQFVTNGMLFVVLAIVVLMVPHRAGPTSLRVMVVSAWLTWFMALSEAANAWWGANQMLPIAAQQAGATGAAAWQEAVVKLCHLPAALGLILSVTLLIIGIVQNRVPS
jgi:hydroxylaminobenzene mutase